MHEIIKIYLEKSKELRHQTELYFNMKEDMQTTRFKQIEQEKHLRNIIREHRMLQHKTDIVNFLKL